MSVSDRHQAMLSELQALRHENASLKAGELLKFGGGGGMSGDMETRVTKLETHMEYMRADMTEVKRDLKAVIGLLGGMPTKRDLDTWRWQWIATGAAIIALTVGGITGGLALIAHYAG